MRMKKRWLTGLSAALLLTAIGGAALWMKRDAAPAESPDVPVASSTAGAVGGAAGGGGTGGAAGVSEGAGGGNGDKAQQAKPTEKPIPTEHADVVVVGSEMEGMYLARAAADEGLTVRIIDPREQPGGQLIQAEMQFLDETRDASGKLLVQGRVKELFDGFRAGRIRKQTEFVAYYNRLRQGIPLESGITVERVEAQPGAAGTEAVHGVVVRSKDGAEKRLTADYWVENTDDATLVSKLKAVRMAGLEAFYGQDRVEYMSAGFMMKFKGVDWARFQEHYKESVNGSYAIGLTGVTKGYKASKDRVFLRGLNAVNQRDGEVLINALLVYTVDPSKPESVREAMELGKQEMPLVLDYFRKHMVGWEQAELNGFPSYPYIREYNHYETDYVLQVSDMLGGRMFPDNVSIAGYPLDLQGISANKWGIEMGRPDKYGMPLRSFQLKSYENVLLAGKNVGTSAIAYGSARIQPNTALAAESIGVILGQIHGKKQLRELTAADWSTLHPYLASRYSIQITGIAGKNYLAGWTADELAKLDSGKIVYPSYVKGRK